MASLADTIVAFYRLQLGVSNLSQADLIARSTLGRLPTFNELGDLGYTGAYPDRLQKYFSEVLATDPPVAPDFSATVAFNSSDNVLTPTITGGAADSLAIVTPASHGTATVEDLTVKYTPTTSYQGSDSIVYSATNIAGSDNGTISVTVSPPPGHRYWRIKVTSSNGDSGMEWLEVDLRDATVSQNTQANGTYTASSTFSGYGPEKPASPYTSPGWASNFDGNFSNVFWECDFKVGNIKNIDSVAIRAASGGRSPKDFLIQYSDDNSAWTTSWAVSNAPSFTTKTVFTKP